jgi:hypothetical protein
MRLRTSDSNSLAASDYCVLKTVAQWLLTSNRPDAAFCFRSPFLKQVQRYHAVTDLRLKQQKLTADYFAVRFGLQRFDKIAEIAQIFVIVPRIRNHLFIPEPFHPDAMCFVLGEGSVFAFAVSVGQQFQQGERRGVP